MIPQGWQSIGEPDVPELSPDAKAVQAYIDTRVPRKITYKSMVEICRALRMGFERVQDAIYEIRKQEAIMARKPKINKEQRAEMLRLHNEERYSVGKLASKYGCSQTAVKTALQAAKIEAEDETMKNTGINPEFDAAVDQMIEETAAPPAEGVQEQPAELEPVSTAPEFPDYVLYAVDCRISDLEQRLQEFADQKAMLEHQLRRLQSDIEDVQDEHDKLAAWKLEVDP